MTLNLRWFRVVCVAGRVGGRWLVVAAGVDGQLPEQFAGGGVDDADVEVVDEHEHVGSGVGSSDAEVVQPAGHAQGDHAAVVDAVVADTGVGVVVAAGGREGLGEGAVGGSGVARWGRARCGRWWL
jgi:hypothetical protein